MCFVKTCKAPLVAETDIEVYKMFRKVSHFMKPDYYTGPYRMDYVYEDLHGEYFCEEFGKEEVSGMFGFHSFKNFDKAVAAMDRENSWAASNETFEIIPCIIPKGTKYYEGYYINTDAYVSEKIILKY